MKGRQARNLKIILIVLLVCITVFNGYKYFMTLKEKYVLLKDLNQARGEIAVLTEAIDKEKELHKAVIQENLTLKEGLNNLTQLEAGLRNAEKTIEQLTSQVSLAKAENIALREEKENLALELTEVSQERDTLKVRLSSIPELKRTIKEVKTQIRKARAMTRELAKKRRVIEGNRGYLIKDGKSTYPITKIKIEVMPVP